MIGIGLPVDPERTVSDDLVDIAALAYQLTTGRDPQLARDGAGAVLPMALARPGVVAPRTFESMVLQSLQGHAFVSASQMRQAMVSSERTRSGERVAAKTLPRTGPRPRSQDSFMGVLPSVGIDLAPPFANLVRPTTPVAVANPSPPRRSRALWIALAALVLGAGLLWALSGGDTTSTPTVAAGSAPDVRQGETTTAQPAQPAKVATPTAAPAPVAVATPVVAAPVAPAPSAPPPPAPEVVTPPAPTTARLSLTSDPDGAEVTEGGKVLGRTPLTAELVAGRHQLVLTREGHDDETFTIDLDAGRDVTQALTLTRVRTGRTRRTPSVAAAPVTAPATPPVAATPPPAEPPRPKLLGNEPRPKLLGQETPPPVKVLGPN